LPGIYIFEGEDKKPLYIGKSINLRHRLKQHLDESHSPSSKQSIFVPQTKTYYFQTVSSDLEAILLEASLIKFFQPKYNSISKDDKSSSFITIGNPSSPVIKVVHSTDLRLSSFDNPKTQVFGPFNSRYIVTKILKQVRRIFGYCANPLNSSNRSCFYYHLHQCPGPCNGSISPKQYRAHLGKIKKFLSGKFKTLTKDITRQINRAARKMDFEQAHDLAQELSYLNNALFQPRYSQLLSYSESALLVLKQFPDKLNIPKLYSTPIRIECYDAAHLQGNDYVGAMSVFVKGEPATGEYRRFVIKNNLNSDPHALRELLTRRFRHFEWDYPDLVVLDGGVSQLSIARLAVAPDIAVIALSKKKETIHYYDQKDKIESINLSLDDPVLSMLRRIRDEAHRWANSYYRLRKRKSILSQS